ncbi:MAG: thiamine pyrophosphate-binding protein [Candidatus Helarchaeales archaeon]
MPELTGGEIIAEYLIKEQVPHVFAIPGHGNLGIMDAFRRRKDKIKIIQVKQEMSGVHMAEGYYRVTGKPLAMITSIGPGALNTAIGLANAYVDSMPVLVITGDTHVHMRGVGVLQEIERDLDSNLPRVLEPLTKRSWQAARVEQVPRIMQRAFNQMLTGRRGPVYIDMPMDVQCDSADVTIPEPEDRKPKGRVRGDPAEIKRAVELLMNARRPVILVGGGLVASGAFDELKQLAEMTGAAVINTMMGIGAFPADHPLYAWATGSKGTKIGLKLSSTADVLLAIGCRFADETSSSYRHGISFTIPPTKLIQIDIDPTEIGKNYPVTVGILGDAKAVLSEMIAEFRSVGFQKDYKNTAYFQEIQGLKKEWNDFIKNWRDDNKVPVMISTVLSELREFLNRDAIIVTSSGNTQAQILQEFPFYEPNTCITAGGFSTMGFTIPAALGVKLALPDRQVVGLLGDGDFMMTMQELATAVQYDLDVVFVVCNNYGWIAITDLQRAAYGKDLDHATEFKNTKGEPYSPHLAKAAEAFGCHAERISKKEEIKPALQRAFDSKKPAVLEILTCREFPYTGSPAHGWWDVPKPAYLKKQRKQYLIEKQEERLN